MIKHLTFSKRLHNFICMTYLKLFLGFSLLIAISAMAASNDAVRRQAHNAYSELDDKKPQSNDRYAQYEGKYIPKSDLKPQSSKAIEIPEDFPKPVIMVMPTSNSKGLSGLHIVANNPLARAAMDGINEYLTQNRYEVKYIEGESELKKVIEIQQELANSHQDPFYLASLTFNADVYIKFSGSIDKKGVVSVDLNAYETSTNRLLGTHNATINSHGRLSPTDQQVNLKTAAKKAMPGLESKIFAYWAEDLKKGFKYNVIMNIRGEYDENQIEDLQEDVVESLKESFKKTKVNLMTTNTIDLVVYTDLDDVNDVYSAIRKAVKSTAQTKKISINKKLIIMDIL